VRGLDGLRGLAAFVVLTHHQLLTNASLMAGYDSPGSGDSHSLAWWMTYTPLHIMWDGTEAVFLFFVLSGYVLALPVVQRRPGNSWTGYFPRRLIRLYVPVFGALAFALLTVVAVPRHAKDGESTWLASHATAPHGLHTAVHDAGLLGQNGWLITPLWSLRYEVIFSLLLPLHIVTARRLRAAHVGVLIALLSLTALGSGQESQSLMYLPMFGVGVMMAVERETMAAWAPRVTRAGWLLLVVLSLALFNDRWTVPILGLHDQPLHVARQLADAGATAGAALIVFMVCYWPPARRATERPTAQRLGKISFSLYLVHEPVIVAIAFVLGGRPNPFLLLPIGTTAALLCAVGFQRLIEGPSHRLARAVGAVTERTWPRVGRAAQRGSIA
jgi:peptidoglycan/LPS O-acetylase OafA/YrhL